jgi:hypothetical protein
MQETNSSIQANTETSIETKKVWSAPELQKIDIEQITANDGGVTADTPGPGNS